MSLATFSRINSHIIQKNERANLIAPTKLIIKIKVVNEKNREVIVSGDSNYIMGSVGYILHRISVVEGVPYEKLIFDLVEAHKNVEESGVVN